MEGVASWLLALLRVTLLVLISAHHGMSKVEAAEAEVLLVNNLVAGIRSLLLELLAFLNAVAEGVTKLTLLSRF